MNYKRDIIVNDSIYELTGFHQPSLLGVLHEILGTNPFIIKRIENTKIIAEIICVSGIDSEYAVFEINKRLSKYGYEAERHDKKIFVNLSFYSLASILLRNNGIPLCATIKNGEEKILFLPKNGFSGKKLIHSLEDAAKEFKKEFNEEWKFPKKIKIRGKDVILPKFDEFYDWDYVEFLLNIENPTIDKIRTYDAIYLMVRNGVDFISKPQNQQINELVKILGEDKRNVIRHHIEAKRGQNLPNKLNEGWIKNNQTLISSMPIIRIPNELIERIQKQLLNFKIDDLIDYSKTNFLLRPHNPSDIGNVIIIDDGTGVMMHDSSLGDIIVRTRRGKPYCEYHQFEDVRCVHIEKADLDGQLRKISYLGKPDLPQAEIKEEIMMIPISVHFISNELKDDLEAIRKQKRQKNISETACYILVNTFNKELGELK